MTTTRITISTELGSLSRPVHVPRITTIGDVITVTTFYGSTDYTITRDPFDCGEGSRLSVVGVTSAGTEMWFYATL